MLGKILTQQNQEVDTNQSSAGIRTDKYQHAMADLTREQWEDYKNRFLPVQNELLELSQNDQLLTEQLARNETNIENSFNSAEQNESIRMGRYGLSNLDTQQSKNNNQLLKSLTTASVNNETRQAVDDLQNKIITGQGAARAQLADIGKN
ncbi:hypothetical protein JQC92_02280 [Shewanella sp. 202IG2-18]|uniref:hypothetical protein n=1 Tax=Parashewanella hymeniacidonis TaxID=2807618 RepID=UPI00196186A5|nr:hypothetical protein [Parashewanella hymeniacidonis]MBM7070868.1 hypothetical protein [Parashewanella hymeniacidonis]